MLWLTVHHDALLLRLPLSPCFQKQEEFQEMKHADRLLTHAAMVSHQMWPPLLLITSPPDLACMPNERSTSCTEWLLFLKTSLITEPELSCIKSYVSNMNLSEAAH